MSKKRIVFVLIIILILLFFLTVGIISISRFVKLNKILDKAQTNIEKDNYYLKSICQSGDAKTETTAYYRNGIGRYVAENGIYTWTDGKDAYMIDEEDKTLYVLSIEKSPEMLVSNDMFAYLIPGYSETFWEKMKMVGNLWNKFSNDTIDGEKCYKILIHGDKFIKTTWISQKSLNPVKSAIQFQNGDILEYIYDLKFTATKITSIELPDINEYKVIDYETKEVIVDEFVLEDATTEETDNVEENTVD